MEKSEQRRLKDKAEWEAREHQYKDKIRELNQRPNGVPMTLFKLIKEESESRKLEIEKLRKKTAELEGTLLLWDAQAKANIQQMQARLDRPMSNNEVAPLQRAHQVKAATSKSSKSEYQRFSSLRVLTETSHNPHPTVDKKEDLAIQGICLDVDRSKVHPTPILSACPPVREPIDLIYSGAQITPHGSKKIKVASIPSRRNKEQTVLSGEQTFTKAYSLNSKSISKSKVVSELPSKENQVNKVTFSFPTPDENKGQTGLNLRLKMVREAGGRRGLLEKLEKIRSPRSIACAM